jgi:hypothetical protein
MRLTAIMMQILLKLDARATAVPPPGRENAEQNRHDRGNGVSSAIGRMGIPAVVGNFPRFLPQPESIKVQPFSFPSAIREYGLLSTWREGERGTVPGASVHEEGHVAHDIAAFGLYRSREALESAVEAFRAAGFRNSDVSVLIPRGDGSRDLAHEAHTKAPEGAVAGAGTGAIVGGVLGWLVGLGALAIPGVGPFVAAGPLVSALAGVGAFGATGGLIGALAGIGIPEFEAKRFEGRLRRGHLLLSVHCDDREWARRAEDILTATSAEDVATTAEAPADYRP